MRWLVLSIPTLSSTSWEAIGSAQTSSMFPQKRVSPWLYRWNNDLGAGQLLTPGDEPIFPYAGAAAIHPSKPLVIFPKDRGGDVNYELYTLDYSKNVLEKITGPIGRIFYTFWVNDYEWLVVGHDKETVYVKSLF
jgi:hypothetical protein